MTENAGLPVGPAAKATEPEEMTVEFPPATAVKEVGVMSNPAMEPEMRAMFPPLIVKVFGLDTFQSADEVSFPIIHL